jgi:hypothetical protein
VRQINPVRGTCGFGYVSERLPALPRDGEGSSDEQADL